MNIKYWPDILVFVDHSKVSVNNSLILHNLSACIFPALLGTESPLDQKTTPSL